MRFYFTDSPYVHNLGKNVVWKVLIRLIRGMLLPFGFFHIKDTDAIFHLRRSLWLRESKNS